MSSMKRWKIQHSWMGYNAHITGTNCAKLKTRVRVYKVLPPQKIVQNAEEAVSWSNGMLNIPKHEQWKSTMCCAFQEIALSQ